MLVTDRDSGGDGDEVQCVPKTNPVQVLQKKMHKIGTL